jgi:acyl-CoA reductase-like NAD-dependent aldehyde dehydrogenase
MVTRKVAPALAAGCTVVLKPAEQSPLTAIASKNYGLKAGGPPDVFQVVTTSHPAAFSDVFFEDARVRKLTFTGSTESASSCTKRRRALSSACRSSSGATHRSSFATTRTSRRRSSR